jgi:hypothetical protein
MKQDINPFSLKLGKLPAVFDERTLTLTDFLPDDPKALLATVPDDIDWAGGMGTLNMWGNGPDPKDPDQVPLGDCAFAGPANLDQGWRGSVGSSSVITLRGLLMAYHDVAGFDSNAPLDANGNNPTDNGACLLDVLKYWVNTGIGGTKIAAFAAINPSDIDQVRLGMYACQGILDGLELPASAAEQLKKGLPWSTDRAGIKASFAPGSWGGHCTATQRLILSAAMAPTTTWAQYQDMTLGFWATYCSEAYVLVSQDQLDGNGYNPLGIDFAGMKKRLQIVQRMDAAGVSLKSPW